MFKKVKTDEKLEKRAGMSSSINMKTITYIALIVLSALVMFSNVNAATQGGHGGPPTASEPGKGGGHSTVKAIPVTLADRETMTILRTDWLKKLEEEQLSEEKVGLSGLFWIIMATLVSLIVMGLVFFYGGVLKRFNFKLKLSASHGSLALLAVLLGAFGYIYLSRVAGVTHLEASFLELDILAGEMNVAQGNFLLHGIENKTYGETQVAKVEELVKEFGEEIAAVKQSSYLDAEQAGQLNEMQKAMGAYVKDWEEVVKAYHEIEVDKEELDELGEKMDEALEEVSARHEAELARLEAQRTDVGDIATQTRVVENLAKAEILALKVSHGEVEFLLDKRADRVEVMAKDMGLLKGYLKLLEEEFEDSEEKAKLREVQEATVKYTMRLKNVIRDEAIIEKNTSEAVELLHQVEIIGARLSHQAQTRAEGMEREADMASIILIITALLAGTLLSFVIVRAISKPAIMLAETAGKVATGDINQDIEYQSGDEMGKLANSFRELITYIKGVAGAADALSKGDLTAKVEARSERDVLSKSFIQAMGALREMVGETNTLIQAAQDGKLDTRGDAGRFEGAFAEIVGGINGMLDATLSPIQEAGAVLEKVAARDLTVRVKGDYKGDHAKIKDALNTAVDNLDQGLQQVAVGAEQVSSASEQISTGSQSLAQGTSEQASSLEEVSSNLQEMTSMTKQSASSAKETQGLADGARKSAANGVESMKRLSGAIDRMKTSADETSKIVKTIDEIAFQTNLLALNAAVEAARAGDAGKGFAVVAEEVRNLAIRSADAAKNTASMIEESVKNAEGGVRINQEVLKNLEEISTQVDKVSEVMRGIAASSDQQTQGVDQIATAVEQMNQITQLTAASSEESASAAEELSSQAEEMRSLVTSFQLSSTNGAAKHVRAHKAAEVQPVHKPVVQQKKESKVVAKAPHTNGGAHTSYVDPKKVIPLSNGENENTLQEF